MSDIVERLKEAVCLPDTGCMSVVMCVCDVMQDASDEIEKLRETVIGLCVSHGKLDDKNKELREDVRRLRVEAGYD